MITVWKYTWPLPKDSAVFRMPGNAEILTSREQGDSLCIWARVESGALERDRHFALCGTGHKAPADGEYIGTAMLDGGSLVLPVFELPNPNTRQDRVM